MAPRKNRKKKGKGGGKKAQNAQLRADGGFVTSVDQKLAKQQKLLEQGKSKKAAKVGDRLSKQLLKQPEKAMPIAQSYAQDEFQTNLQANRPNQQAIGGGREYVTDPETGQVTVVDSLAPEQQQLYDQQIGNIGAANQAFSQAMGAGMPYGQALDFSGAPQVPQLSQLSTPYGQALDFSGLPQAPQTADLAAERQRIEGSIYDRNIAQVDKSFDRRRENLEQRLYETGNPPGTPGYERAMADFNDDYSQTTQQVAQDATATAGTEFERSFNIGTAGRRNAMDELLTGRNQPLSEFSTVYGIGADARQRAVNEQVLGRQQPLSELGALASLGGGPTALPNFFNFQPVQYQGPQYQDFLGMGIEQNFGQQGLNLERQALNQRGGGGVSAAVMPSPAFSIGGLPPGGIPNIPPAPNAAAAGFASGFSQGVGAA